MDRPEWEAYIGIMFSRIVTIIAMLALAVVTTVTSAHASRMSGGANGAVRAIEMMQAHGNTLHCVETDSCNSADAEICAFVCAGLSVYLLVPIADAGRNAAPDSHDLSYGAALMSRIPRLSERPPKHRLL